MPSAPVQLTADSAAKKTRAIGARYCPQGVQVMTKYLLASAAALAMMTGVAFAQSTSTQSTTTVTAPAVGSYSKSETQSSTDGNGVATDKSTTYQSGPGGMKATSSSKTVAPDGSMQSEYKEKHIDAMQGSSTVSKETTTTTTDR
jgi:hypothetical protein